MHVDGGGSHEAMIVHKTNTDIGSDAPHASVGCDRQVELTGNLEGGFFGKGWIAGHIEGNLHTQHVAAPIDATLDEIGEFRSLCPLPGRAKQVAIGKDEATRHSYKGIHCRVSVVNRLQAV